PHDSTLVPKTLDQASPVRGGAGSTAYGTVALRAPGCRTVPPPAQRAGLLSEAAMNPSIDVIARAKTGWTRDGPGETPARADAPCDRPPIASSAIHEPLRRALPPGGPASSVP